MRAVDGLTARNYPKRRRPRWLGLSTGLVEVVLGANETLELAQSTVARRASATPSVKLDAPRFVVVKRGARCEVCFSVLLPGQCTHQAKNDL